MNSQEPDHGFAALCWAGEFRDERPVTVAHCLLNHSTDFAIV